MKEGQKLVKYIVMAFAAILAVGIISICVTTVVNLAVGVNFVTDWLGENISITEDEEMKRKSFTESFDASAITKLDIHNYEGKLTICVGDELKVEAVDVYEKYVAKQNGSTLYLGYEGDVINSIFDFLSNTLNRAPEVTLTVPAEFVTESVQLDFGSGATNVSGLTTGQLNADTGSGSSRLSNITVQGAFALNSGSGSIHIENLSAGKTILNSGSGSVRMSSSTLTARSAQSCFFSAGICSSG